MRKVWFLKALGISLFVFAALFFMAGQTLADTYIEIDPGNIDYSEARYIQFEIDADEDYEVILYMKDNNNDSFRIIFKTDNKSTDDTKYTNDNDLIIYLDDDEYADGSKATYDSSESDDTHDGDFDTTHMPQARH